MSTSLPWKPLPWPPLRGSPRERSLPWSNSKPNKWPTTSLVRSVAPSVPCNVSPVPWSFGAEPKCNRASRSAAAPNAGGIFFPQRPLLQLDSHGYSPAVLHKIVTAGGLLKSFAGASQALTVLAEIHISERHVGRLTEEIGGELRQQRDAQTALHRERKLGPQVANVPTLVAVEVDGGRLHTRSEGQGPGVHGPAWREDKVACLQTLHGDSYAADPQPEPPPCFTAPDRVAALAHGVQQRVPSEAETAEPTATAMGAAAATPAAAWQPQRLVRTCVATMQDSNVFGAMVAAEAQARNFYAAARRAFLGDGQKCNWTIQQRWFRDFVPIVDFIHVVSYVYAAAQALGATPVECWDLYRHWLAAAWQGRVGEVIAALADWQERLGAVGAEEQPLADDPRLVVKRTRTYLMNNQERMHYPEYRRQGLPVTSALVESLIKEFNYRVKGTEKFWNESGAEDVLQVRAALLSDDERLEEHLANRPGSPYRRYARRPAA